MQLSKKIWILGALGRTGLGTAEILRRQGHHLVLVGRREKDLQRLASKLGGACDSLVANTYLEMAEALRKEKSPVVVCNFIGPFTDTAPLLLDALPAGSDYLDLANDIDSVTHVLGQGKDAQAKGQCLVPGAGFGVYAAEALVISLAAKISNPESLRTDSHVYIEATGPLGATLAATIVEAIPYGGACIRKGRLTKIPFGAKPQKLFLPDGSEASTGAVPTADLIVAQRASKAPNVLAASSMAPSSALVRALIAAVGPLFRFSFVKEWAKKRLAAVPSAPPSQTKKHSWMHGRLEGKDGVAEGWLKLGEGMQFTCAVAAEVAHRLSQGHGKPGAYNPGELFGTELATTLGAELING